MASSKKRDIKFLEIAIQAEHPRLVGLEAYKLTRLMRKAEAADFRVRETREGAQRVVKVCDAFWFKQKNTKFVALLFSFADRDAIGATFEDLATGEIEHHQKKESHGGRTEAHLVIRLKPVRRSGSYFYPAALEATKGLAPGAIGARLNGPLRVAGSSTVNDRSGELVKTGPLITVSGMVSENLMQALEKGTPLSFELTRAETSKSRGIDAEGELQFREELISFRPTGPGFIAKTFEYLTRLAKDEHFSKLRIRYRDNEGTPRTTVVTDFDTDIFHQMIQRGTSIKLTEPMDYNHIKVVKDFARSMAKVLAKEWAKK